MKASLLTFSQSGNTLKVAHAIASGLTRCGFEVENTSFLRREHWNPADADLVGIGCPVFENRPVELVPAHLESVDLRGKNAFVFITSGGSPARSLWHLAEAVRGAGATVVGGIQVRGASVFPTLCGMFPGRPNEADLAQAEAFAQAVAEHVTQQKPLAAEHLVDPSRGRGLYDVIGPRVCKLKKMTSLPTANESTCDLCGTCVTECPSRSIRIENKRVHFKESCIRCYWCWQICPKMAIDMKVSPGNGGVERLLYSQWMERRFGNIQPGETVGANRFREVLARKIRVRFDPDNRSSDLLPAQTYSRRRGGA